MITLGIDPGSQITGYGIIQSQGNRNRLIAAGPIRLNKIQALGDKLLALQDQVEALIREHKPNALALEKVFHGVNFNSALKLGYVRGVVILAAAKHQIPLGEYAPTEVKKAVCGNGRAEKQQIQEMVRLLLNLPDVPKPHDVADALAIAICHAHQGPILARYGGGRGR
ncbi:crossover junction endodeoxyribonuclease RuvC [Sulfidibacter corallicola]|uniref:Crossover junction endodeoxyribonuclease RuvC n=1 Tax=Sulfidibacter corallicola TaxID=2818388 RepID=A0A8A4TR16_SULCO|nr:crossover junction endodeoxyribonuclease RuvC [Sulfidibacter corallicola]QTD51990.1 crossover junction endodeoxyribonuclease RuvC [Sulfidibacter corallicola]